MHIYSSASRVVDRSQWGSGVSTYETANRVGSYPGDSALASRTLGKTPEVRDAALSALRNERFGTMLERISDPRSSDAMMRMGGGSSAGVDQRMVFSSYAENSD